MATASDPSAPCARRKRRHAFRPGRRHTIMPTETTDPAVDDPDGLDSTCSQVPIGVEGPTDARCGADAVTYVFRPAGHRTYLCPEHAELINRFGDDAFADGHPTVYPCDRCNKPTPVKRLDVDGICEECQA